MGFDIFKTDNLIKVIPGVILFYSFIFIYGYYDIYDINVASIYSLEELLLVFLPIIRPLIFVYQAIQMFIQWQPRFKNVSTKVIVFGLTILLGAKFFDSFGRVLATTESDKVSCVSFLYEGEPYSTDDNLIPLGDTKKYIILRDKSESTNLFFEREKVRNLITQ